MSGQPERLGGARNQLRRRLRVAAAEQRDFVQHAVVSYDVMMPADRRVGFSPETAIQPRTIGGGSQKVTSLAFQFSTCRRTIPETVRISPDVTIQPRTA